MLSWCALLCLPSMADFQNVHSCQVAMMSLVTDSAGCQVRAFFISLLNQLLMREGDQLNICEFSLAALILNPVAGVPEAMMSSFSGFARLQ